MIAVAIGNVWTISRHSRQLALAAGQLVNVNYFQAPWAVELTVSPEEPLMYDARIRVRGSAQVVLRPQHQPLTLRSWTPTVVGRVGGWASARRARPGRLP
ncbi:hypothetical protein GCM10022233_43630 [Streptomyces shaanxiensis]|uniref:Uncharacterized protein n=1 Tax=Streptomyces shaanxiensis TaxID=653357 RepID=A0ABP7VCW7_9ACTN